MVGQGKIVRPGRGIEPSTWTDEGHGELLSTKSGCRVVGHTNFISCAILVSVTTGPLGATSPTVIPQQYTVHDFVNSEGLGFRTFNLRLRTGSARL